MENMFQVITMCLSDSQVGVLRVWNVSRSTPLDSFKLKKTGFHALHVLNSPLAKKGKVFSVGVKLLCLSVFLQVYLRNSCVCVCQKPFFLFDKLRSTLLLK